MGSVFAHFNRNILSMARKNKTSLFEKFTSWIKGSLEKFAAEGFSKEGLQKRSKSVPSFLKVRKKRAKPAKKKVAPKKVSGAKKAKSKPVIAVKKKLPKKALPKINSAKISAKGKAAIAPKPLANKKEKLVSLKKPAPVQKAVVSKPAAAEAKLPGILVGKIAFYFSKANACAFQVLNAEIKDGAKIRIVGPTTDFKMAIKSIQINRIPVPSGRPGEDIGIGVTKPVVVGDSIYLI